MLEINKLFCGYGARTVLKDINLNVEDGGLLGILGPNGSGKTTLLRAMTGVLKPGSGEILFKGRDVRRMSFRELAQSIAVVSQDPQIGILSVEEFVLMGRIPHYGKFQFSETRRDREIAQRALALTKTEHLKERSIWEISGGEKQLICIARALAQEPSLLLLDEPTTHLDITHQIEIMELMRRLNKDSGLTVIMILHDLNLASEFCRTLALLHNGMIHACGTPENVLTYQAIEEVYKATVVVKESPVSLKPYCFLVSRADQEKGRRL